MRNIQDLRYSFDATSVMEDGAVFCGYALRRKTSTAKFQRALRKIVLVNDLTVLCLINL